MPAPYNTLAALASILGASTTAYGQAKSEQEQTDYERQQREAARVRQEGLDVAAKARQEADDRRNALRDLLAGVRDTSQLGTAPNERVNLPEDAAQRQGFNRLRGTSITPQVTDYSTGKVAGTAPAQSLSDVHTTPRWQDAGTGFQTDVTKSEPYLREERLADQRTGRQEDLADKATAQDLLTSKQGQDAATLASAAQTEGAKPVEVTAIRTGGSQARAIYDDVMQRLQQSRIPRTDASDVGARALVDDLAHRADTSRKAVPTTRPLQAMVLPSTADGKPGNPMFDPNAAKSFVADSTAKAGKADQAEGDYSRALDAEIRKNLPGGSRLPTAAPAPAGLTPAQIAARTATAKAILAGTVPGDKALAQSWLAHIGGN